MSLSDVLFSLQDVEYRDFQQKLIPSIDPAAIIGVRTPVLRQTAKELGNKESFLTSLPHTYFEENQIHAFLLEKERDFAAATAKMDAFLPYVDNWATCDQLRPKVFAHHKQDLLPYIQKWLASTHPYTIRFGISMLMCHFLDEDFKETYLEWISAISHEDYYVKMMVAWYFATALAKQYSSTLPYISAYKLSPWIHRKTIQKAVESYRISKAQKDELKQYRM